MLTETTEFENSRIRVVKLDGLPRHPNFPYNHTRSARYRDLPQRKIEYLVGHQTAGSFRSGHDAALALARYAIAAPKLNAAGKVIGGGRGWPGAPYTFLITYPPPEVDGRLVIYRLWDDDWWTWHTGGEHNSRGVACALVGSFRTRHAPQWSESARDPHPLQVVAFDCFVRDYALPHYGLKPNNVLGHFDAGKKTCPGDLLESWIRSFRGETTATKRTPELEEHSAP